MRSSTGWIAESGVPVDSMPEPVGVVGGVAAALVAVATAVRKVVIPMWKGLQALAQAHQAVIEGAELARRELAPNHGGSIKDKIDATWDQAEAAREQAAWVQQKVEQIERRIEHLHREG